MDQGENQTPHHASRRRSREVSYPAVVRVKMNAEKHRFKMVQLS